MEIPPCPKELLELVDRYERNKTGYQTPTYKETELRREFIDPFFELLGWDVQNKQGWSEAYKEVIHEYAISIGGSAKAPDYCFRVGGTRKFFVEAKKPSVNVKDDPAPALQLRRYGWNAKLPLCVLTDFEEFVIYDTRIRPKENDAASVARVRYLTHTDYVKRWDLLYETFSKEAVLKGSFDKYAADTKDKKGTSEVDDAFLQDIESWRGALARNVAIRNPQLSQPDLNFAVQSIIDRIIFLRIGEDRGIESYGRLQTLSKDGDPYGRLKEFFRLADERYNSGLFHFQGEKGRASAPDTLTPGLDIDPNILKEIVKGLYYPESPYEFSVLPPEILGQVYEQFLGKVIRLTPGHRAVVEDKPEVKKAGGVYYTPAYIVENVVKNTLGKLLAGKTPQEAAALRIADPACGSGSFLIGAYQYLLDWHLEIYSKLGPKKRKDLLYEAPDGSWRLKTDERRRILLNNIYGVDIDPQAVEVTKLSLLLKVLEKTTGETLDKNQKLFHERALPDLDENIKCGNSLLDYTHLQQLVLGEDESRRINAFNWKTEFPQVFSRGGFDAVIGNPPYIRVQTMTEWAPLEVELYKKHYQAAGQGNYDIYVVFVERGLSLLGPRGRLGFILPHKFFNSKYGEPLRRSLAKGSHVEGVVHFGDQQVFDGATTYTCLLFLTREASSHCEVVRVTDLADWRARGEGTAGEVAAEMLTSGEWNFAVGEGSRLFEKLRNVGVPLANVASRIYQGSITSADPVFIFKESRSMNDGITEAFSKQLDEWVRIETAILKDVVRSGKIGRYWAEPTALVLFPYRVTSGEATLLSPKELEASFPLAWDYLRKNKSLLENREKGSFKDSRWYRFGRSQNLGLWEQPKLLVPYMITDLSAYYDKDEHLYFINVTTGGYGITLDETKCGYHYLCALLNSRLLDFYLKKVSTTFHGGYFAANKQYVEQLPIRLLDLSNPDGQENHDRILDLVKQIQDLKRKGSATTTDHEKRVLERQVEAIDSQLNNVIYNLYGLTDAEIHLCDATTRSKTGRDADDQDGAD